jgi:hypothetical protein
MVGFSGDLAGLPIDIRTRLSHHAKFYKRWREFMTGSICHLLTPIANQNDRGGWVAFQLQSPDGQGENLVLVYRLDDGISRKCIPLRELDPEHLYSITNDDAPGKAPLSLSG